MGTHRRKLTQAERNPVAIRAAVTALATAVVHVTAVYGLVDPDQEAAIGGAIDAAGLVVLVLWARTGVTPNAKVITRVTTGGAVVAGDAAEVATGTPIAVTENLADNRNPSPTTERVAVRPELVDHDG